MARVGEACEVPGDLVKVVLNDMRLYLEVVIFSGRNE